MKKIFLLVASLMLVCGCQNEENKEALKKEMKVSNIKEVNQIEGLSVEIKEGSLTKDRATIIITDLSGDKHIFGGQYHLEVYKDDNWYVLNPTCDNCVFTLAGALVDENNKLEMLIGFEWLYGSLNPGKYRIIQYTFLDTERPITEDDYKYYSVEFEI